MPLQFTTSYLKYSLYLFRYYKTLAERAMAQVTDEQLFVELDEDGNSIAIIIKHMAGNMRSRWVDFQTGEEKPPDRNREGDLAAPPATREALMQLWEESWGHVFHALEPLADSDLGQTVTIRGEAHSVMQAINRQVAHYAMHIGQIVMLAKHFAHDRWQSC